MEIELDVKDVKNEIEIVKKDEDKISEVKNDKPECSKLEIKNSEIKNAKDDEIKRCDESGTNFANHESEKLEIDNYDAKSDLYSILDPEESCTTQLKPVHEFIDINNSKFCFHPDIKDRIFKRKMKNGISSVVKMSKIPKKVKQYYYEEIMKTDPPKNRDKGQLNLDVSPNEAWTSKTMVDKIARYETVRPPPGMEEVGTRFLEYNESFFDYIEFVPSTPGPGKIANDPTNGDMHNPTTKMKNFRYQYGHDWLDIMVFLPEKVLEADNTLQRSLYIWVVDQEIIFTILMVTKDEKVISRIQIWIFIIKIV